MSQDGDGWVIEDPQRLANEAGLDVETYSLARAIASEAGSEPIAAKRAIGFAIRNESLRRGVSLLALTTTTRRRGATYRYGAQYHDQSGDSRYVSTARAPTSEDIALAKEVLASTADPVDGASRFFQPGLQDRLVAEGRPGYRRTGDEIMADWGSEGWQPVTTVGTWVFLRHRDFEYPAPPYDIASIGAKFASLLTAIGTAAIVVYTYTRRSS